MIDQLKGEILEKHPTYTVIMVGGVGYKVNMSINGLQSLPNSGNEIQILTYLHVREDILDLYGFFDSIERNAFHLLTSISGIGPKLALTILSGIVPEILNDRIINGDVAALTSVPGVGAKTAKRIIVELKEKFIKSQESSLGFNELNDSHTQIFNDTVYALVALGYKKTHASKVCTELEKNNELEGDLESVIKKALKLLMS